MPRPSLMATIFNTCRYVLYIKPQNYKMIYYAQIKRCKFSLFQKIVSYNDEKDKIFCHILIGSRYYMYVIYFNYIFNPYPAGTESDKPLRHQYN